MIFALLSRRLRMFVIGALLVRLAPVLARLLYRAADGVRRRGGTSAISSVLTKTADAMSWMARRRGRSGPAVG